MEKIYRDVKIVDGLKVSIDGEFIYNGKTKNVYKNQKPYNNHKTTAVIHIRKDGKVLYFQAAKLVASAWKVGYNANEDYIIYYDGDCQNIHADNLQIVNKDRYWQYMQRNSGNKVDDVEKRKKEIKTCSRRSNANL
jgi:hypothetical protein